MAVSVNSLSCGMVWNLRETHLPQCLPSSPSFGLNRCKNGGLISRRITKRVGRIRASSCFDPIIDQPVVKEALKEPVAFLGGIFAGILRLDLEEEPLKEWVARTVEAAGVTIEDIDGEGSKEEEVPQQIVIE